MRTIAAFLIAAYPLLAAGSAVQTPVFPAGAERVVVDVVVTDGDGQPVAGLTRDDFVVEDEGRPQTLIEFEAVDVTGAAVAAVEPPAPGDVATNAPSVLRASPRAFLIVFDDLNLSPASGRKAAALLQRFIERQLRDSDCVTVAPTAGGAWWSGCLGSDREDLVAALGAMRGRRMPNVSKERLSDWEALRIHLDNDREALQHVALRYMANGAAFGGSSSQSRPDPAGLAEDMALAVPMIQATAAGVFAQARERNEQILRSLERGLLSLPGGRGRRSVILASNGFIRDQRLPGFQRVREAARRANAALYFVDADDEEPEVNSPAMASHPDPDNRFRYVAVANEYAAEENSGAESLAADTGGFTIRGDLERGLGRLNAESRVFYLLGYAPSQPGKEARFRKIKVSVRRPGVKVRARSGYYSGPPPAEPAVAEALPPPAARQALDAVDDARELPLRMATYVLGNAADGRVTVLLAGEVDPAAVTLKDEAGRLNGAFASYSSLASRDTGEIGRKERVHDLALRPEAMPAMATTWLPVTHLYELVPGRYQARLVVSDRGSGRTGSVRQTFDVPKPTGLRLTTPVLTDILAPGGSADAPARPLPVARRAFGVGSRLVCGVELWGVGSGAAPDVLYEVWKDDGTVVARSPVKPLQPDANGTYADVFRLTLNRPGDYELRVQARDRTGGEAVATERFSVTPSAGSPPPAAPR